MNSEQVLQIQALIEADPVRMSILSLVQSLGLPDCWVGAGFLRSAVWDHLHQRAYSPVPSDIDVIWVFGYGWPVYLGGPMKWADQIGLKTVVDGLKRQAERLGPDFSISPLLAAKAEKGETFN